MKKTVILLLLLQALGVAQTSKIDSARILSSSGMHSKALEMYFQAMKEAEEKGNKKSICRIKNNIAQIYVYTLEYEKAKKIVLESIELCKEIDFKKGLAYAYGTLANVLTKQNNFKEAIQYFNISILIFKEIKDVHGEASFYISLSDVYLKTGNEEKAFKLLQKCLLVNKKSNDISGTANCFFNIGDYFKTYKKDNTTALKYYRMASDNFLKANDLEGICDSYKAISDINNNINDYRKYIKYRDSLLNKESIKKLTEISMQYEFSKKEAITEMNSKKLFFAVILLVVIIVFFSFFSFIINRNYKMLSSKNKIIEEKQKEILASIRYAQKIQKSLLTSESYIEKCLLKIK